jgi:hypothetical protein
MENEESQVKVCRSCHTLYKKLNQKYCGNGCEKKTPFVIDGKINTEIAEREIILTKNENQTIRWICLQCHAEYDSSEIRGIDFKCSKCNKVNDIYPFNFKSCGKCKKEDGKPRDLLLTAVVCDLCGEKQFILNNSKKLSELSPYLLKEEKKIGWLDNSQLIFEKGKQLAPTTTNLPSITLTVLNNNYEYKIYGENKVITVEDLIHDAQGFMPDSMYARLLEKCPSFLFKITYKDEKFFFDPAMDVNFAELNSSFKPVGVFQKWNAITHNPVPENKLLSFQMDFLKFQIFVY